MNLSKMENTMLYRLHNAFQWLIWALFILFIAPAWSQRIESEVITDLQTLPQEKQDKLMDFVDRVRQFLDGSPWCNDPWNTPVYLNVTLRLEDMSSGAEERYKGTIIISNSYDIQFSDLRWRFAYQSGDPILYEENNFDSFTSVLAFYVNMILGGEFDKWGTLAGTPYYEKARNIAEQSKFGLGRFIEGWDRRLDLVNYFLSDIHRPFREMVDYYFYGLSYIGEDNERARKHCATAIKMLDRIVAKDPDNEYTKGFINAHYQEIVEIYRRALNKEPLRQMLVLDPDHERIYRDIIER
ncbi:DUF4835 family protein [candidate division KSB1 bacterium]|nr:MAG: DUF4835 family protein [candidate division KSB1 bacterium]